MTLFQRTLKAFTEGRHLEAWELYQSDEAGFLTDYNEFIKGMQAIVDHKKKEA